MTEPVVSDEPKRSAMRFRRTRTAKFDVDGAKRQGEITKRAFLLLGRDRAIDFLNSENAELGARPLDLAIANADGRDAVEAVLGRLANRQPAEM
ncbi:MAG: antitoxin Xre/MbcA/ParS toxin-binding domain-containing protein [Pseudomonadota bacterium]